VAQTTDTTQARRGTRFAMAAMAIAIAAIAGCNKADESKQGAQVAQQPATPAPAAAPDTSAAPAQPPAQSNLPVSPDAASAPVAVNTSGKKPNILVIFGDDIGQTNISAYSMGLVGYRTPNIDRIAREGMMFTDYYAENSCTAGRSSFITGQSPLRTGLSKVGVPGGDRRPSGA